MTSERLAAGEPGAVGALEVPASEGWKDAPEIMVLLEEMRERPFDFDFFAAVRRIECLASERPRVGRSASPREDPVRFGQDASLSFSPSPIAGVRDARGGRPPRLMANFFGLLGPNGPMPLHLTEYLRERQLHYRDEGLARFLDIFHNRMTAMFYRAWALNQAAVSHDRPEDDRFAVYVGSLAGIGMESLAGRDEVPDIAKLHYSGRLSLHTKNAEGLRELVGDFFGVPARLEEFVGQWLELPRDAQCRLGESRATGELGRSVIAGSRVWDVQQKFRFVLGPMGLEDYRRFLPTGTSFPKLVAWVRNYCGFEYIWDARLILRKEEVPRTRLGAGAQLGWTTWVMSGGVEEDRGDLVLRSPD